MHKLAFRIVSLLLLLGILVLPAFAQDDMGLPDFIQHSECAVDMTGVEIPVYHFGDLSGPYAFITQPLLAGIADAIAYYNAHGGACGATFVSTEGVHYRDTGGVAEESQAAYDYYSTLDPKPTLLVLYASGDAELLRSQVAEDEIPVLISAGSVPGLYGEDGQEPGWIFATNPLYADQLGSFCDYLSANADMYPEPTIGYISWPGAFGEAAFNAETMSYCASVGVTILDTPEYFPPTATDISTQVQNLVDAGANILYTNSLASGPVLVAATVHTLGLENEVTVAGVNWVLDTSVGLLSRTAVGADGLPVVNGMLGSLPFYWWTEVDQPGIALIREQAAANERGLSTQNIAYLLGWTTVDLYAEVYIQTANRVGSMDAVTGAEVKATIEGLDYQPLGLQTINFEGGALRAARNNRIARLSFFNADMTAPAGSGDEALKVDLPDGTQAFIPLLVPLTDFAPAPDLRPGGADVPG